MDIKTALLVHDMAIWLNWLIFPIGQTSEASRWRVCYKLDFFYCRDKNKDSYQASVIQQCLTQDIFKSFIT